MKIKPLSKMSNKFGFIGAVIMAQHGVINQWASDDDKYSIIQMDYGLSVKNHKGAEYPYSDLRIIAKECLGLDDFKYKVDGGLCRIYPIGELNQNDK